MPGVKTQINMRLKQCVTVNPAHGRFVRDAPRRFRGDFPVQSCPTAVSIPPISLDDAPFDNHLRSRLVARVRLLADSSAAGIGSATLPSLRSHSAPPCVGSILLYQYPSHLGFLTTWRPSPPAMFAAELAQRFLVTQAA